MINGFYGINDNLITQEGPRLLQLIGQSYAIDKRGAIGILWNGGGATASYTISDQAYVDLNDFLKIVIPELNLASHRVISFGGSRGAYTALNIASHPKMTSIKVKYVHAMNPFNDVVTIHGLVGSTVFQQLNVSDQSSGYYGSWDKSFRLPNGTLPSSAPASVNLDRNDKLKKLVANNTAVKLFVGTHDSIVPTYVKTQLFETYRAHNVNVEMTLFYLNGHTPDRNLRDQEILSVLINTKNLKNSGSLVTPGKVTSFLLDEHGNNQSINLAQSSDVPLLIEIPRSLNDNIKGHLIARGTPGANYVLTFVNAQNQRYELSFGLDNKGYVIQTINSQAMPYGELEFQNIKKNGGSADLRGFKTTLPLHGPLLMNHNNDSTRSLDRHPASLNDDLLRGDDPKNPKKLVIKSGDNVIGEAGNNNGILIFPTGTYSPPELSIDQNCSSQTLCTVKTIAKVNTLHVGQSGSLYAYVIGTGGRKNYYDGKGNWVNEGNITDGKPLAFFTGTLSNLHIDKVAEGDLRSSIGLAIYFGYGLGSDAFNEMNASGRIVRATRANNR